MIKTVFDTEILTYFFSLLLIIFFTLTLSCREQKADNAPSQDSLVISHDKKVTFIELGSVSCIPCKAMVPIMDTMRNELGDQVDILFYDVWTEEGKPYSQNYKIRVIPTQIFLNEKGDEYFRHEGYFPIEELYPVLEEGGVILP